MILFSYSQVVERERNDSKAEQEKLNTQIQEFLKELEVIVIQLFCPAFNFDMLTTFVEDVIANSERGKIRQRR